MRPDFAFSVGTISNLRILPPSKGILIDVEGYYKAGDGGGGSFIGVANNSPGTYADNGGTIIVPTGGDGSAAWERSSIDSLNIRHFGASTDIANNSPFAQKMLDVLGKMVIPAGDFPCQDEITISPASTGITHHGLGKEKCRLVATGMSGKKLVNISPGALYRQTFRDLGLVGDADYAFYCGAGIAMFMTLFDNCYFKSSAADAVRIFSLFSTKFNRCDFESTSGNSIWIAGGNTVYLDSCYALLCGPTSAGYRIETNATLINCNGMNMPAGLTHFWGHFGVAGNLYDITLIGCNVESWGDSGIKLTNAGNMLIEQSFFTPNAGNAWRCFIWAESGSAHCLTLGQGVRFFDNVNRTGGAPIVAATVFDGGILQINSTVSSPTSAVNTWYNTAAAIAYEIPTISAKSGDFGHYDLYVPRIKSDFIQGFRSPPAAIATITANASTYAIVVNTNYLKTANTVATNLDNITGGVTGQYLFLYIGDANTTIRHGIGAAGRFLLPGGANLTPAADAVYQFVYNNTAWRYIGGI